MKRLFKHVLVALVLSASALLGKGQTQNLSGGVAIDGYDAVSYFTAKAPLHGNKSISTTYNGATYCFASSTNLHLFKKNPEKYVPAYGGFCAYAMGKDGSKVSVDPETYKIKNGKLLLFYNKFFTNTLESWNKDEARLYLNAEKTWTITSK